MMVMRLPRSILASSSTAASTVPGEEETVSYTHLGETAPIRVTLPEEPFRFSVQPARS